MKLTFNLTVETAKKAYNWFFHAFGTENNPKCTPDDIVLKDDLEEWLLEQGE